MSDDDDVIRLGKNIGQVDLSPNLSSDSHADHGISELV